MSTNNGKTRTADIERDTYVLAHGSHSHEALESLFKAVETNGTWDDGCFYYNGKSASELQEPLALARTALKLAMGDEG